MEGIRYDSILWVILGRRRVFSERRRSSCSSLKKLWANFGALFPRANMLTIFMHVSLPLINGAGDCDGGSYMSSESCICESPRSPVRGLSVLWLQVTMAAPPPVITVSPWQSATSCPGYAIRQIARWFPWAPRWRKRQGLTSRQRDQHGNQSLRKIVLSAWALYMCLIIDGAAGVLLWCHNGRDGFSDHQHHNCLVCLLNRYSSADQRKHQSSASLAFVRGIQRWPVNSPQKGPVTRKMLPFDDVIMHSVLVRSL